MDHQSRVRRNDLERMVSDESVRPRDLPLPLFEDITGGFSCDQEIGRGGFAVVYKGILTNGAVAVKRLINTHIHETKFQQEVGCLMKAKHKNVVRFLGYCADTQDASNGLEYTKLYQIIKVICEGLHYLHKNKIVHLDIKPSNILLDDNMVPRIADFGLSRCFDENQSQAVTSKLIGSMGYMAPEFYSGEITFKSDIYSLGVIITEILTGKKGPPVKQKRNSKYQQESVNNNLCSGYYTWEEIKSEKGDHHFNVGFVDDQTSKNLDYFVVVDFKATCEKGVKIYPQEIIEFSSVLVDGATGQLQPTLFHTYVRPRQHPKLTDFCRDLNGIRQKDVDSGVELAMALRMHSAWLQKTGTMTKKCRHGFRFAVATWGNWDCRHMLEPECRSKGVGRPPYLDRWINLWIPFAAALGDSNRRTDLADAVRMAGMEWEGRPRGASDDACNTARLLGELVRRGVQVGITSSLATMAAP